MSLSNSRLAYADCYSILDQALEEPRGVRVEVASLNDANYLRMRIHHARAINRQENSRTYPDPDEPLHGRSVYDIFVVRIEEGEGHAWVYLDKQKVEIGRIEPIEDVKQIGQEPRPLMIEGPKAEDVENTEVTPPKPQIMRR